VEAVLKNRKLKFTKACRGSSLDYSRYDLIITVGGDGTFLEAARQVKKGLFGVLIPIPVGVLGVFVPVILRILKFYWIRFWQARQGQEI
jgi:NAD kinase